jgi:hypothetical protein
LDSFLSDVPFCRSIPVLHSDKKYLSTRNSIIHHETGIREKLFTMELMIEISGGVDIGRKHLRQ